MAIIIKIPTKRDIYKYILLWAYRKVIQPSETMPVGIPHNRDPEYPCPGYEPTYNANIWWDNCETDGHYLCTECSHIKKCEICKEPMRECDCDKDS